MTAAERDKRRSQDRERLAEAVRQLATREDWQRFLDVRRRFHHYSLNNQLLIWLQRPEATRVAGYRKWEEFGRHVVKGEKAIKILAPRVGKSKEKDEKGEPLRKWIYFVAVSVFDVSQTVGDPLPEMPRDREITGEDHAHLIERLTALAEEIGVPVAFEEVPGEAQGFYDPMAKKIVVEQSLGGNARVRVLTHEIAHALGVGYDKFTRADAEVIVETATAIALTSTGLDTSGESLGYLVGWGNGSDFEAFEKHAATIDKVARRLEDALVGAEVAA